MAIPRCNRCRKKLTREASIIKGIGPICEKRGLKALGDRAGEIVKKEEYPDLLGAFDKIKEALFRDGEAVLDLAGQHQWQLQVLQEEKASRIDLLEVTYQILADVCNQIPGSLEVADAVKYLFFLVGVPEEGEAAHKRICGIIKKAGVF